MELLRKLKELIDSELTERQSTALSAELGGTQLGSNSNSLYQIVARRAKEAAVWSGSGRLFHRRLREAWG